MYKHLSKKEHMIYTFSLAMSTFHDEPYTNIKYVNGNRATMLWHRTIVNMPMVGLGVEWQRQFYKKVYFFAGLEWKAGYGSGSSDTLEQVETIMPPPDPNGAPKYWTKTTVYTGERQPVDMLIMGAAPHIGAKLEFKRFTIGTMYLNYLWFTTTQTKSSSMASIDLDVTNIYHRFFVGHPPYPSFSTSPRILHNLHLYHYSIHNYKQSR
jgi:hypothetical protein